MPMYLLAAIPLIKRLNVAVDLKQVWYTDDATASGSLPSLQAWWDHLLAISPAFGYNANTTETWLLTKEEHVDTNINITNYGRPYLGAPIGSSEFVHQFVADRVNQWTQELLFAQ